MRCQRAAATSLIVAIRNGSPRRQLPENRRITTERGERLPDDPSERRATQADNPVAQAIGNELLSRVLLFASAIDDEANRVIFMNDLIGERGRLKKKEKHDHDEELLACLEQHGEFTTGALRKRRARLENALEQFLGMNGGGVA